MSSSQLTLIKIPALHLCVYLRGKKQETYYDAALLFEARYDQIGEKLISTGTIIKQHLYNRWCLQMCGYKPFRAGVQPPCPYELLI